MAMIYNSERIASVRAIYTASQTITYKEIGHFYFTKLLLPTLIHTSQSTADSKEKARVITTSSSTHMFHGPSINFETLRESPEREKLGSKWLYQQSKYVRMSSSEQLTISLTFVFL